MTAIVGMALGHRPIPNQPPMDAHTANFLLNASSNAVVLSLENPQIVHFVKWTFMSRVNFHAFEKRQKNMAATRWPRLVE